MSKRSEVPGDSLASAKAFTEALVRAQERVVRFERTLDRLYEEDVLVLGFSVRVPGQDGGEYMVVVRAWTSAGRVVGFHGGPTLHETLSGVFARLENNSMKWKEDKYADSD